MVAGLTGPAFAVILTQHAQVDVLLDVLFAFHKPRHVHTG